MVENEGERVMRKREKKQQNTEPESVSFNGITYDVNNNKVYLGEA